MTDRTEASKDETRHPVAFATISVSPYAAIIWGNALMLSPLFPLSLILRFPRRIHTCRRVVLRSLLSLQALLPTVLRSLLSIWTLHLHVHLPVVTARAQTQAMLNSLP